MTAIRRAVKALLIAEAIMVALGGPVVAAFWMLTADGAAHFFTALIGAGLWLVVGPMAAFGPGGCVYDQLKAADDKRDEEMRKLLAEHGS